MLDRIGTLGDRLLARIVPHAKAHAQTTCWNEQNGRVCRRCCYANSNPNYRWCTDWEYC